jgi:hypothetical protein
LSTNILCLSARNREKKRTKRLGSVQPNLCSVWHTGLSGGAPDSVRCAKLDSCEQTTLGRIWRRTAIIHRTVRWCTGLSGEPTVASATVGRAIRRRRVARANGRQGHRTVRCAPNSVQCANCHSAATVICTKLGRRSAPDCPVHHLTDGNFGLPCWPPTALSCLGAIKGTPRCMEESPKHTLSIPRLLVLTFTQSLIVLEIGALFEL